MRLAGVSKDRTWEVCGKYLSQTRLMGLAYMPISWGGGLGGQWGGIYGSPMECLGMWFLGHVPL